MKTYDGFAALLAHADLLPNVGWIFVDAGIDRASKDALSSASFHVAETEAESIDLEKSKRTFLECPTFVDIKSVADERAVKLDADEYLDAVLYYREYDDFQN